MSASSLRLGILVTAVTAGAQGALQALGQNMEGLRTRTQSASQAHEQLGQRLVAMQQQGRPVDGLAQAYTRLGRTIEAARAQSERFAATQERIQAHQQAAGDLWGQAAGVAAMGLSLAAPVRAAMQFESAFADVRKVLDGSEAEMAGLSNALLLMGRTLPLAHTEIAALAAAGGQLGVAMRDLPSFVETTAQMAVAFDMQAAEAGDAMAKIANVYQIPIGEIGRLGDAINQISNESPARASEIVRALSRVGGTAQAFGLSAEQASALSGAFIAMGRPAEVAGTAINALLIRLQTAGQQGPAFQAALAGMGMSAQSLQKAIGEDAQGALMGFLQALEAVPKDQRMGRLVDMFGLEYADDIAILAGNVGVYAQQLDAASRAEGSMGREFAARSATTANNMQLLRNTVTELGINIGTVLLPPLNNLLGTLRPMIESLAAWAQANPALVSTIGKVAAVVVGFMAVSLAVRAAVHLASMSFLGASLHLQTLRSAYLAASLAMQTGSLAPVLGGAVPALDGLLGRVREIGNSGAPMRALGWHVTQIGTRAKVAALAVGGVLKTALLGAGQALLWVGRLALMNPIGLALTAAALLIYKFWGPISGFFRGLWSGLVAGLAPIGASVRAAFAPLAPLLAPVGALLGRAAAWFGALIRPMDDAGGAAQAFGHRVGLAIAGAVQSVMSLPGRLMALPAQMLAIGGQIVAGLIQGIRQKLAAAGQAVAELGAAVRDRLKGFLGIRSPSRVFAELGGNLSEGLALGMGARLGAVTQAAAGMAAAATVSLGSPAVAAEQAPPEAAQIIRQAVLPAATPALPEAAQIIRQAVLPATAPALPEVQMPTALRAPTAPAAPASAAGQQIHFAPVIHVGTGAPAGVGQEVQAAMRVSFDEFERLMRRYQSERARISP